MVGTSNFGSWNSHIDYYVVFSKSTFHPPHPTPIQIQGDVSHAGSHAPRAAQDAAGAGSLGEEAEPGEGGPVARPDPPGMGMGMRYGNTTGSEMKQN